MDRPSGENTGEGVFPTVKLSQVVVDPVEVPCTEIENTFIAQFMHNAGTFGSFRTTVSL